MNYSKQALEAKDSLIRQISMVAEKVDKPFKLYFGESDMATPEFICRAAYEALQQGHTFYTNTAGYMDLRHRLHEDLMDSLEVINRTDTEFEKVFGRRWGGLFWKYRMNDAKHAIVSMGSLASESTLAADFLREQGFRAGVVGVRTYRPFPAAAVVGALEGVDTVAVFEKDVSYGYAGALAMDLKAALFDSEKRPKFSSFVAGLGGRDVRPEQLAEATREAITGPALERWIDVRI